MKADEAAYNRLSFLWGFSNSVSTDASLCTVQEWVGGAGEQLANPFQQ